ncbi:MAG: hypothetical protein AAF541_16530 [Pseudomonadota bacterium]
MANSFLHPDLRPQTTRLPRFKFATLLACAAFITGCASVDLGSKRASSNDPDAGVLTLQDGKSFRIAPDEFNYSGRGHYALPDGRTLEGLFANGKLNGDGQEATAKFTYIGQWRNGRKQGKGSLSRADGSSYEGEFQNDLPHGKGKATTGVDVYTGSFLAGKYHGEGQIRYGELAVYKGQWQRGLRHGFGQYSHASGELYVGDWQADKAHGFGTQSKPKQGRYEGAWISGNRQGYGSFRDVRGITYEGIWHADQRHGYGREANPDGTSFEGEWRNNLKHGTGKLARGDGSFHAGDWSSGYILGPGTRRTSTGIEISGIWNQDIISNGLLRTPSGQEYAGPLFKDKGTVVAEPLLEWLEEVSRHGDAYTQLFLAGVYRNFAQPAPDPTLYQLWLKQAATNNLAQAQYELATTLLDQDAAKAIQLLNAAAEQNHPGASQRLGEFYHVGLHVKKDQARAIAYYEAAIDAGALVATNNLAWLLATTPDEQLANPERAFQLIQPIVTYLGNWQHIDTLAAALARQGNTNQATRMQKIALDSAAEIADSDVLAQMQARLALYSSGESYIE